jgi:hypothetical protein
MWAAGPPKPITPSLTNSDATSRTDSRFPRSAAMSAHYLSAMDIGYRYQMPLEARS